MKRRNPFSKNVKRNRTNKILALLVTLALWLIILGRKEEVLSRDVSVDVLLSKNYVISDDTPKSVIVTVSGTRMALKNFSQSEEVIVLNLENKKREGIYKIPISKESALDLPVGVKLLSIEPEFLNIKLSKNKQINKNKKK